MVVRCPKFVTHQVILCSIVPEFSIYRLSATSLLKNSGTILFVSENQEEPWKHRFQIDWCKTGVHTLHPSIKMQAAIHM